MTRENIDAHCERARAAGAIIAEEPSDQFCGDPTYRARDPEGRMWMFAQTIDRAGAATRVTLEHYGWDALAQQHAARQGFPLGVFQLRLAEWWRALLNAYAGRACADGDGA